MCKQIKAKRAQGPIVDKDVNSVEKGTSARQQIKRAGGELPKWNQKGNKHNQTGPKRMPKWTKGPSKTHSALPKAPIAEQGRKSEQEGMARASSFGTILVQIP